MAKSGRVPKMGRKKNTITLTADDIRRGYTLENCPTCGGSGEYHQRVCNLCGGGGKVKAHI